MQTSLDHAFAAMAADPDDATLRLGFHERVLDAELVVPLDAEADETGLRPQIFELSDGRFVLAFDRDERMADFLGAPAHFAALSGRRLAGLLAGEATGIALNLGAASATLLPPEAVAWMARIAAEPVPEALVAAADLAAPGAVPAGLLAALGVKLAAMAGPVAGARLVAAVLPGGERSLLLALDGVPEPARDGVAAAVAEAVRLSGLEAPGIDVIFPEADSPLSRAIARLGLRLELPAPAPRARDDRPPRLR